MTREEELDAMETKELVDLFIKGMRKIANEGAKRGLTEEQSLAEFPFVMEAVEEIIRISEEG